MAAPSLVSPNGYSSSSCGYCSPSGSRSAGPTSKKYGMVAPKMSPQFYQNLIDRGWRRSGTYVYHPDMERTCCPQYTIRLDVQAYKPSKKHRQVVNRFNRYIATGQKPGEAGPEPTSKGKGKAKAEGSLLDELKVFENGEDLGSRRYTTELVPAKATAETFNLYKRYQMAVHNDPPEKVSLRGFNSFLCDSPITNTPIRYSSKSSPPNLTKTYGSYHLLYRVDNKLIGISVIDILPSCVSSVYFIWDPDWAWASLGKLSAIREIALVRDMREAGATNMGFVYMGYWIAGCVKMRYKSEYSPSYLLDPGTQVFHALTPALDNFLQSHQRGYYPFAQIEADPSALGPPRSSPPPESSSEQSGASDDEEEPDDFPSEPTPGFADPQSISKKAIEDLAVYFTAGRGVDGKGMLLRVSDLQFRDPAMVHMEIRELAAAVGIKHLMKQGQPMAEAADRAFLYFG